MKTCTFCSTEDARNQQQAQTTVIHGGFTVIILGAFARKLACSFVLFLLALAVGNAAAYAQTRSTSVADGTLSWTATQTQYASCGSGSYSVYSFSDFSFTSSKTNFSLGGSTTVHYISSPGGSSCPANGPQPASGAILDYGGCKITFIPTGSDSGTASGSCGVQGYIDPKYVVVGVTYAPPGPSANTFVNYEKSTYVGNTTSTINTFTSSSTFSIALTYAYKIASYASAEFTGSYATTSTQKTANTSTVTTSVTVDTGEQTSGTGNYFAPVDNDYDVIWVWLNPVSIYTLSGTSVVWNGYGYDATDQNGMDIVGIPLGYLNGDFGAMPSQYLASTNRAWAAGQMYGAGQSAALDSADFAQIASFDPFSNSTYGPNNIGYNPPSPSTPDNRFTLSECNSGNSISYDQASPSSNAGIATCTLKYVNLSTQAQAITNSSSQTYSVDASFTGTKWFEKWKLDVKNQWTYTTETEADSSITNSTTNTGSLSVQGPPCNNSVLGVGPCIPVYDAYGTQPVQFDVYQDNMFGTFMFAPVHYF
jgi:hypothetical protein